MKDQIDKLLFKGALLKGREIAKELGFDRSEVNAFLHAHLDRYKQDSEYRWSLLKADEIDLTLPDGWVDAGAFEEILSAKSLALEGPFSSVRINFPSNSCKTMIDCTARLLALMNQLVHQKKAITVDFTKAPQTHTYLDRAGFFDLLDKAVTVLPNRPERSAAKRLQGQSDTLVEFGAVDPKSINAELKKQLTEKFVQQSSEDYQVAAYTVFGELIDNVKEHSKSRLYGFAGLQRYKGKKKRIQTVITDSGVGIASTLRPALEDHYPPLFKRFGAKSIESDMGLVEAAMSKGGISRFGDGQGRGLGFKSSREQAAVKFDASFSVRQEQFCLRFEYRKGRLVDVHRYFPLSRLLGTHICFDFYVD